MRGACSLSKDISNPVAWPYNPPMGELEDNTTRLSDLTSLTQTWVRRLQPQVSSSYDALIIVGGPSNLIGKRIPLERRARKIPILRGPLNEEREPSTEVHLPSEFMAEDHACLEATRDGWHLKDNMSRYRTYVGTVKISDHRLVFGDEVRIGDFVMLFVSAERDSVPVNAVDPATGLLMSRVFLAEISLMADHRPPAGQPDFGLLLIQVEGLRNLFLFAQGLETTPTLPLGRDTNRGKLSLRTIGRALLQSLPEGVVVARLESNLFAAAWTAITPEELHAQATQLSRSLLEVGLPLDLGLPTSVIASRQSQPFTGPQVLTSALSTLETLGNEMRGTVVEADMEKSGYLVKDRVLLDQLRAAGGIQVLLISLQDEDYLRHQLGNQRLAGLRWNLRRAVRSVREPGSIAGVLDSRIFIVQCTDLASSERLLRQRFAQLAPNVLQVVRFSPPRGVDREQLSRLIITAVDTPGESFAPGQREPVNRLPTPVAGPYRLIWVVSTETARIKAILVAFDSMIRFTALTVLAAAVSEEQNLPRVTAVLENFRTPRLTLGMWLGLLRELALCLDDQGDPIVAVLRQALGVRGKRVTFAVAADRELLPFRNVDVHGNVPPCEQHSAKVAEKLLGNLNELIRALAPLRNLELISVIRKEEKRYSTSVVSRILTDARENYEVRKVYLQNQETKIYDDSCYLATMDYKAVLDMDPLVKFSLCPHCEREEIFLPSGVPRPGKTIDMIAVTTGHRFKWTPEEGDFPPNLRDALDSRGS